MEKIRHCPKCCTKFNGKEEFCPDCGSKIVERDPEVDVNVKVELGDDIVCSTSMLMSLEEFFDLAKKKGLIK